MENHYKGGGSGEFTCRGPPEISEQYLREDRKLKKKQNFNVNQVGFISLKCLCLIGNLQSGKDSSIKAL